MIWTPHVTVAAVIERDGKFLLVEEGIDGAVHLNQPAGHLENGETVIDAVIRETLEETARHFTPESLLGIYRWQSSAEVTYIRFAFAGKVSDPQPGRALDEGILQAVWLETDEILLRQKQHRSPLVQQCVNDYLRGNRLSLDSLTDLGSYK